ncbi:MAG: sigma 54-interacting transcriptional regulator, partial [gamma proteobacterium symbiont of Ctena orbiculata]
TNQDLEEKIAQGEFREDLYYRISEITINIPPLRERAGDAVLLAWSFLKKYAKQNASKVNGFTKEALKAIEGYAWPGNVRELENRIKRSVVMADDQLITPGELQLTEGSEDIMPVNLRVVREQAEATAIIRAMSFVGGNVSKAADLLGVSRPTLYDLVNKYGLK